MTAILLRTIVVATVILGACSKSDAGTPTTAGGGSPATTTTAAPTASQATSPGDDHGRHGMGPGMGPGMRHDGGMGMPDHTMPLQR